MERQCKDACGNHRSSMSVSDYSAKCQHYRNTTGHVAKKSVALDNYSLHWSELLRLLKQKVVNLVAIKIYDGAL